MCVTYCHRMRMLYWNHQDCHSLDCGVAGETHGRCQSCRHRQSEHCTLTNTPLPEAGGCCHYNVAPLTGPQVVSRAMLAPLHLGLEETEEYLLKRLEAPYQLTTQGQVLIEPDDLGLPFTYGLGTEHGPEEAFDWSAWLGQWCQEAD